MGDLELLFQEQHKSLKEDLAEHQAAMKGKAKAMGPSSQKDHASIMVIEEDSAVVPPTRPGELITLQPQDESRWMVRHMPHFDNTLISHQSDIPSTTRGMEGEASVVQAVTESAKLVEPAVAGSVAASEIESAAVPSVPE